MARLTLKKICDVQLGGRGTDFVTTWIEVRKLSDPTTTLYLNSGRLFGWWALFTGANVRIARALSALIAPPAG